MNSDPWEIGRALESKEFIPHFLPLVTIESARLAGFEVLARWKHPTFGLLSPDTFIPRAERDGWISKVMDQVLRQGFSAVAACTQGMRISFNVSPLQLQDADLPEQIHRIAAESGFPVQNATMEITESAITGNIESARSVSNVLKAMGCRIALDDFGTGYSALSNLRCLPFDELKVDRSFVSSMVEQSDSHKFVAAVVGLGRSLGLDTVAEGVETLRQAELLHELGCQYGQGWLYSKPVPAAFLKVIVEKQEFPSPRRLITPSSPHISDFDC